MSEKGSGSQNHPAIWGRLAALSSLLLAFSYPPIDLGWLAWGALLPWLFMLEEASPPQAFLRSYLVGLLFFGSTIWWIGYVTVPGVILLTAYLALFFAVWGWAAARMMAGGPATLAVGLAAFWAILEYLRAILLTGFGWNLLAHTQWHWLEIIQVADVTGVYGVSFLIVLVNVALWAVIRRRRRGLGVLLLAGLYLAAAWAYGFLRIPAAGSALAPEYRITLVQGNIPQREKWDEAFQEVIWKRYEQLTADAVAQKPELIIWPETAVPDYLDDPAVEARLAKIVEQGKIPMLVGAPFGDTETGRLFNSAVLFDIDGTILQRYDKVHLVPFGEYLPLEPVLGWLRKLVLMGTFSHGNRYTIFQPTSSSATQIAPSFSVLICFEDLFPGLCRRFVRAGARYLVVITNDAWFGRSAACLQHLQASVFRAVEERMWVVRAANTGWTGFVDPVGRPLDIPQRVRLFKPGVATVVITPSYDLSPYARWGDWFQILCLTLAGLAFFPSVKGYNKSL